MIYLDTNVFVYALSKNVDDVSQKERALKYLRKAIESDELVTSEIILYEFAFVSKKLREEVKNISENLEFISDFIQTPSVNLFTNVIAFMNEHELYRHSFDVYHLCYSQEAQCNKFVTFDKGFKKLQKYTNIEIIIL